MTPTEDKEWKLLKQQFDELMHDENAADSIRQQAWTTRVARGADCDFLSKCCAVNYAI